jgi:hypothetical protein
MAELVAVLREAEPELPTGLLNERTEFSAAMQGVENSYLAQLHGETCRTENYVEPALFDWLLAFMKWGDARQPGIQWNRSYVNYGLLVHEDWTKWLRESWVVVKRHLAIDRVGAQPTERYIVDPWKGEDGGLDQTQVWLPATNYDTVCAGRTEARGADIPIPTQWTPFGIPRKDVEALVPLFHRFVVNYLRTWLPISLDPEQVEANRHHKECLRLQAGPAGRKAKQLLLDNLNDGQARDYLRHGYFITTPQKHLEESINFYLIERGYANGNILRIEKRRSEGGKYYWYPREQFCFHSAEPYPVDDILLAQKLLIETAEDEFKAKANLTKSFVNALPVRWSLRGT